MKKLNLHINIDPNSGFCFGVVNAIKKAEINLGIDNNDLFCLGEIVHNQEEINRLENKGLKTINNSEDLKNIKNKRILFRAHGEPPTSYEKAHYGNNEIIDATCPIIIKLQSKLKKSYNNNEKIYIYGKKNHPEIIGLNGQINNEAVVFDSIDELDISALPKKITLYSQTTKSAEAFQEIITRLRSSGIDVSVHDTICRQVSNRKDELVAFSGSYDKIIFVAGKNSSNGKVLFDICKKANPKSYFISNTGEINPGWFNPEDSVGISGGTSTPGWLTDEVKNFLENL